ncbi:MAG: NAD(P)/FAD-dependent oxidoreductase, partial [Actinomyces sp.]
MCSLVHITGDPAWIRGDIRPRGVWLNEYQGFLDDGTRAEAVRRALPVLADHRDRGCPPPGPLPLGLVTEMMAYLACGPVPDEAVEMFVEDLHLDGADSGRVDWGDAIDPEVRKRYPVVVVGAGEAGILAGIRLAQAGLPFVIFDRNPGPGGTWWENRYPGARVDVGSHFYCYSFRPADHWSEYFARQPELQRYFADVVAEYGLGPHIRFRHEVTGATWDEATARWRVRVVGPDGIAETHEAAVLISAVGSLNIPNLPDIEGRDDFAGPAFHSARWDHGVELEGARVAMIGAGASGFQIAPTIAPLVEHLTVFQRTAQWMFPNPLYR